jgi:uncharacterized phage-associated protein
MIVAPSDARSVCNAMLDHATSPVTNLALQKLLYFAHGLYLREMGKPLVSGYFEAWKYGPVHPAAYAAFKRAGDSPIDFKAESVDPLTGERRPIRAPTEPTVTAVVARVMMSYGRITPGRLVEISHAPGSPWSHVVDQGRVGVSFGMRIPDSLILERFGRHKISVGAAPAQGEPGEDAPFDS